MIHLDFGFSPWWLVPGAIVSGLAAWWLYRNSRDSIPAWASVLLTGLRFIVILFLFFLLLGPLLNSISRHENLPVIAVLQDDTESLTVQRDSAFVKNEFPAKLKSFLAKFDADKYKIEFHPFAQKLGESSAPDSLTFSQAGTNISGAMDEVRKQYANQNLGAIVLLSDGISTSGANPLYQAEEIHHPVFTVLLGDTSEQKDISIPAVLVNEIAYIDVQTPIQVKIHSNGYENTVLKVNIEHKGKLLEQRNVVVSKSAPDVQVTFIVKPLETGIQQFAITVSQQPDEITYRNNSKLIFLNVLENRVKVALFAGSPHPDLSALREPILNDKRYELLEFVHKSRSDFYEDPSRFNFADFDLVILHNFPLGNTDAGILGKIVDQVRSRNLPVMNFTGIFTDLKTPLRYRKRRIRFNCS